MSFFVIALHIIFSVFVPDMVWNDCDLWCLLVVRASGSVLKSLDFKREGSEHAASGRSHMEK